MLTLWAGQPECLWDETLPIEVRELPADLAALDRLLSDPELVMVFLERWRREVVETGRVVLTDGRPTIAMETYVRLMVLKARYRWGYRSLVAEVSDSIHLRRFCRISLVGAGAGRVDGAEADPAGRGGDGERADACVDRGGDSLEAVPAAGGQDRLDGDRGGRALPDRRGPRLARGEGARARGPQAGGLVKETTAAGAGSLAAMGRKLRALTRTIRRRSGEAKAEVLALTEQTGELLQRSITEARKLAQVARRRARGRGAGAKRRAAERLEELADRCEKVAAQIRQRVEGEPITDRLVSLADPDARPIRKGKLGKPNEFGYVSQICEVTEHTRRGARGLIVPASTRLGNPAEDTLLPDTISELTRLGIRPREIALDGGFNVGPTRQTLDDHDLDPERVFIAGRQQPGIQRTQRRLQRYRTGTEGRISHLKRGYGMNRSRLKGDEGRQIWTGWAILAYNADTLAVRTR